MNTGHLDTLARALEAAGLGGYREAHALLRALREQVGGDDPAHHAAHAAQLLQLPATDMTDLLATADEAGQMSILARLAHAGVSLMAIKALLPATERTV
jgi:hypothetical protein